MKIIFNKDWSWGPCKVPVQLGSKSNSRIISMRGGVPRSIKSKDALDFVKAFHQAVAKPSEAYGGNVALYVDAYYKDRRRDLDVALLQDCLQENVKKGVRGIIVNDRQVVEIHAVRHINPEAPGVVFRLESRE